MTPVRGRLLPALLAFLAATAGCSQAAAPAGGAVQAHEGSVAFQHPKGWKLERDKTQSGKVAVNILGPAGKSGIPPMIQVTESSGDADVLKVWLQGMRLTRRLDGHSIKADRETEVPGAEQAHRMDVEYTTSLTSVTAQPTLGEITVDEHGTVSTPAPATAPTARPTGAAPPGTGPSVPTPDVRMRTVELAVLTEGRRMVDFVIITPADGIGPADIDRIVASLRVDD